jgi:histidine ammonia-lyase
MTGVSLDGPLTWSEVAEIAARGAALALSPAAIERIERAAAIVRAIVERGLRAYGVNTGVGALSDVIIPADQLRELSRKILMSHAAGVGAPLGVAETRAIMVASVNNFAHGYSGLRPAVVQRLIDLLNASCTPVVPADGSVGYISHMAHIGLVLIGVGEVWFAGERMTAAKALSRLGLAPLALEAKEGLCLVNGTPCATGLACLALDTAVRVMDWADAVAAMTFETQRCQLGAIAPAAVNLRTSPGVRHVAARLNEMLEGSPILGAAQGRKTQDALSLRGIPQVHGAVRDAWSDAAKIVDRELASCTDNPAVMGTPESPEVHSEAHAIGASIGLAMDQLGVAIAQLGIISERRLDRMVNPLVSGLPPFLADGSGVNSGFMIAQYSAVSLVAKARRLATPASLDGGVTSGLQEDMLGHATPAALKAIQIAADVQAVVAIELLAACQSYDLLQPRLASAPGTAAIYRAVREEIGAYRDERPFGDVIARAVEILGRAPPPIRTPP